MYEAVSEDPMWNGIYGSHYTFGLQNGSNNSKYYDPNYYLVVSTLKHFDAYSLEDGMFNVYFFVSTPHLYS